MNVEKFVWVYEWKLKYCWFLFKDLSYVLCIVDYLLCVNRILSLNLKCKC